MTRGASVDSIILCKGILGCALAPGWARLDSEDADCVVVPLTRVGIKLACALGTY